MDKTPAWKKPFNWVLGFLIILNILPILAPLFLHWGWEWAAKPIYFIYSFTCHQFAHRSLHIHDHQCAWCSRDMAIWGSLLLVAILVKQNYIQKSIKWYWLIPFTIPIALDGGIQTIATILGIGPSAGGAFYISTNTMRMITGAIFGTGLGLWMLPVLNESFDENGVVKRNIRKLKLGLLLTLIPLVTWLGFIQLWNFSSTTYKPANVIDFQVKAPLNSDFFVRREHGSCPVDALNGKGIQDTLGLECFFGK